MKHLMHWMKRLGCVASLAILPLGAGGQAPLLAGAVPPPVTQGLSPGSAAAAPLVKGNPLRTFRDPEYKVAFDYPASWNLAKRDGEISTFHLDARSAPRNAMLRAAVAIAENPFPASTFSGAYLYFSVTPHSSAGSCARQAAPVRARGKTPAKTEEMQIEIAGIPFAHGHDELRDICITQRDEAYTTYRRGACYRFDLAMNNFCGGEVSGVKDVTQKELGEVRGRLESILGTVRFEAK